jgi:antitoxin component YwqK of YwqJK toxin-antitoxin module
MKNSKIILSITCLLLLTKLGLAQDSVSKKINPDGARMETPYVNGKINGIVKLFNKDGKLRTEIPYVDDKQNGSSIFKWQNKRNSENLL